MTIEELEILASYFHKEATDNAFVNHPERKEWMAERILYALNEDNYLLNQLLACEDSDQVFDLLGKQYYQKTHEKQQSDDFARSGTYTENK